MLGRALVLVSLLAVGACAPSASARPDAASAGGKGPAGVTSAGGAAIGARYFQVTPDEVYWVTHGPEIDRVVSSGARLELSPRGEIRAAAWELDDATRDDGLLGSMAVADHLGGGFVHWSSYRLFRSAAFTGPLEPVALGVPVAPGVPSEERHVTIRGARNGLRGVIVFTEGGPREILPGALRATAFTEPALADIAALDASRAVRLDAFGRAAVTVNGGGAWTDISPLAGIAVRSIAVGPSELWLDTWSGRVKLDPGGRLGEPDPSFRGGIDYLRPFQLLFEGTRSAAREGWPWAWRESSPLQAAVWGGVSLPDGTALGVSHGGVARVDLATGGVRSMTSDWLPQGLECQPLAAADGVLFACSWESYQGYGGYVLRSVAGEPPRVEKAFSDDGYFVADDHGALGFVGSCEATPRAVNPEERGGGWEEIVPKPVFCVRRGPGEWSARAVELDPATSLLGWIPRRDGTAVALVMGTEADALPEPAEGARRFRDQAGVRVLRLYQELGAWRWSRPSYRPYMVGRGAPSMFIDKRFRARDQDGGIDAWITQGDPFEGTMQSAAYVSIGPDGRPALHEPPAGASAVSATGDFGVTITRDGRLFETLDHGRTWRDTGPSPVPPVTMPGSCSRLGCVLLSNSRADSVVRLGWGQAAISPSIAAERAEVPAGTRPSVPRLVCEPKGAPSVVPGEARVAGPVSEGGRFRGNSAVATSHGVQIELVREGGEEPDPSQGSGMPGISTTPGGAAPAPSTAAPARGGKPGKGAPPSMPPGTHMLVWRPPFEPDAPARRLRVTNVTNRFRRPPATLLLGPGGDVSLLLFLDASEVLVTPSDMLSLPPFEPRRNMYGDGAPPTGLLVGPDRALIIEDMRRRLSIEEHGPSPQRPPMYVGTERMEFRKRSLAFARRDDGAVGIMVLDGPAPETAGVVELDRATRSLSAVRPLAPWSTLTAGDDPRCASDKGAWVALVPIDPRTWLELDPRALPRVELAGSFEHGGQAERGAQGMALVRWGRERVCVDALDMNVSDARRGDRAEDAALVARWSGRAGRSAGGSAAALRWQDMRQGLRCSLGSAAAVEGAR